MPDLGPMNAVALSLVNRLEDLRDGQYNISEFLHRLEAIENDLLCDPTGITLKAMRYDRTADFWAHDRRPEAPQDEAYWRKKADEMWARSARKDLRRKP